MRRACILYTRDDAAKNRVLIGKYFAAFARLGFRAGLVITDGLSHEDVLNAVLGCGAVINRTRDAELAFFLEANGVFVSNPAIVNETANDKYLTYERLSETVPMLETRLIEGGGPPLPFPFVAKPAAGHGGAGVTLVRNGVEFAEYVSAHPERSVAQPFAKGKGSDLRIYVIGGRPAAAMLRESATDFRSNFSLGGSASFIPLSELEPDELRIAEAVCAALPLHYAGVDVMRDNGRAVLNEIEDPVGARMLYINTDIDPAELHARYAAGITE